MAGCEWPPAVRCDGVDMGTSTNLESLRELAGDVGRSWAKDVRDELEAGGRRAVGMWPGTLSEARGRAARLIAESPKTVSTEDRTEIARFLYDAARKRWADLRDGR